jgi:orotate phosphoribosyltransferase
MFEECRIEGGPELTSGKISPYYYDFDLLGSRATLDYAEQLAELIPETLRDEIDFVATPIIGGIELAFVVAGILKKPRVKVLTVEKRTRGPEFSAKKYLIVDDVVSSGQAVAKVQNILGDNICVGVAALIFRGEKEPENLALFYLEKKEVECSKTICL